MKFLYTVVLAMFFCVALNADSHNDPVSSNYLTVQASNGDGVFSLLRKYRIAINDCNRAYFYQINELKEDRPLMKGIDYKNIEQNIKISGF